MRTAAVFVTCTIVIAGPAVGGNDPRYPGTLNFADETGARIHPTVTEDPGDDVKEVEYGDYDQDGDLDFAVASAGGVFGERRNKLYRNDGGEFNEVSGPPVIPGFAVLDLSRHLFFRDYDADGWLDLVVVNDELAGGGPVKIYMNNHPGDVFSHFTEEGASRGLNEQASCGGVSIDVDGDEDYDIYSGNYPGPSQDTLFLNDGTGHFTIVTPTHVPVDSDYTIDVASADMNGDGRLDLLITNTSANYAYYNDLNDQADQGVGDYKYGALGNAGVFPLGTHTAEGSMEPGDFNGDGRVDFYWTNRVGTQGDRILENVGNDVPGNAAFVELVPPPYTTASTGHKVAVADLNADGRPEVVVGVESGRPAVLRNTSVGGGISFVDWTPAPAFPTGTVHRAAHAGLFDTNGDGDVDILLGAHNGDHLFENVPSNQVDEQDIGAGGGGPLPALHDADPVAVLGRATGAATDVYDVSGLPAGSSLSVVLNGSDDYRLELINLIGSVFATSDRGGAGVEEAFQIAIPAGGAYRLRVSVLACGTAPGDLDGDCAVAFGDLLGLLGAWGPNPGDPADLDGSGVVDFADLLDLLGLWGPVVHEYVLEALSRNG